MADDDLRVAVQGLIDGHATVVARIDANRRGSEVADLTGLSFLIDLGIVSLEEVVRRIEEVRNALPTPFQEDDVAQRTKFLIEVLQHVYGPKRRGWTPIVLEGGQSPSQSQKDEDQ